MANIINTHYPYMMKKKEPVPQWDYFWLEDMSGESGNVVRLRKLAAGAPTLTIEYSFDKVTWTTWGITSTTPLTITLAANQRVYLRGNNNCFRVEGVTTWNFFHFSKSTRCGGLATSLLNGSNEPMMDLRGYDYRLSCLFYDNTSTTRLVDASLLQLPATTLAYRCYDSMFQDNKYLVNAPELPATTLADYCYNGMFYGDTSLVNAPELPSTTLANNCYRLMLSGCSKLSSIKYGCLTTSPSSTYCNSWVSGVPSTGTFYYKSNKTWTTPERGTSTIPSGWTLATYDDNGETFSIEQPLVETNIILEGETEPRLIRYQNPFLVDKEIYFEPDENGDNYFYYTGNAEMIYDGVRYPVVLENNIIKSIGEAIWDELPEIDE